MQTTIVRQDSGSQSVASASQGRSPEASRVAPRDPGAAGTRAVADARKQNGTASNGNGNGNGNGNANRALVEALIGSKVYQEYERAFGDMTGLPMVLQPIETCSCPITAGGMKIRFVL